MDAPKNSGKDGPKTGDAPGLIGTVAVILMEGGKIGVDVQGNLSKLTAVGLLAVAQQIVTTKTAQETSRIIPGTGIPDSALRQKPGQGK